MFNSWFYPTPNALVDKMIDKVKDKIKIWATILEPSAGKGDIARSIAYFNNQAKVHLIEIEPELREIAKRHGRIVAHDFLTFEPDVNYDVIIMNPPFDNWDEHLLKAWNIAKNTTIVCLLNAETYRNPFSADRKALKNIIDTYGTIEFLENAFSNAERKTNVETALIVLNKKTEWSFSFENFETESNYYTEINETALCNPDRVQNIIEDYKRSVEMYAQGVAMIRKADRIAKQFNEYHNGFDIASKAHSSNGATHDYSDELRSRVWNTLFCAINIDKYMTTSVKDSFRAKMKEQGEIAINKRNIELFVSAVMQNAGSILEESITSVFSYLTKYYKENRYEPEGWAHNETYMVGKKFVLPNVVEWQDWREYYLGYSVRDKLYDIDKALCYLSGREYGNIGKIADCIERAIKNKETKCTSEFFDIIFYKKGTAHFTFRSAKVWADFNIRATKSLNWLPPGFEGKWRQKNKF